MPPMGRIFRFLLGLLALAAIALPFTSAAQEEELTWYAIEVIVFERTSEIGRNAEVWPSEPGLPALADSIEPSIEGLAPQAPGGAASSRSSAGAPAEPAGVPTPLVPMPRAFKRIPAQQYRLADVWERLEKSSAYRPLLHVGWIQPGYPPEEARLARVRNANTALGAVNAGGSVAAPRVGNDSGFASTLSPRITIARDPSKAALDGTVRVHRARYLHVEADLLYYRPVDADSRPAAPAANDSSSGLVLDSPDTALIEQLLAGDDRVPRLFRLTERRRMRSRELHYLDHPLFGVLVAAWPLDLPESPRDTAAPVESEAPGEENATPQPAPSQSSGG